MRRGAALLASSLLLAACSASTGPQKEPSTTPSLLGDGGAARAAPAAGDGGVAAATSPEAKVPTMPVVTAPTGPPPPVRIKLFTAPPRTKATVFWGRRKLGETPLIHERPQGSGPLDLRVTATGFLPVHVRVYTDKNDTHTVVLTKVTDKMKLLGAKKELPPPEPTPDGGTPPAPTVAPATTAPK